MGVRENFEECDLGTADNTGAYGACGPRCLLGEYCGDGIINGGEVVTMVTTRRAMDAPQTVEH